MADWPVVVTNACADQCAAELGLAGREQARAWLTALVGERGTVTDRLPAPMDRRRSPSGYFCLVEGMVALPLAADRNGRPQWIATSCLVFPAYRRHGAGPAPDPFTLTGPRLLAEVNFTEHAIRRFQQRCGGNPDPRVAAGQLATVLGPDVRATRRPPAWCHTRPADFYLVAWDELCLPMSRHGSAGKAFDATTCIHRAADLFLAHGPALAAHCTFDPAGVRPGSPDAATIDAAFAAGAGRLSWQPPPWAGREAGARFWLLFTDRLAAPVAWHPDAPRPLTVLRLARRRTLLDRIRSLLRRAKPRPGSGRQ